MAEKYLAAAAAEHLRALRPWRTVLMLPDCSQCGFLTCPQGVLRARRSFGWDWRGRRWGILNFRQRRAHGHRGPDNARRRHLRPDRPTYASYRLDAQCPGSIPANPGFR